ncbi:hypothetical protein A4A49_26805 [Nicotiana attenuata]|uniref:Carboxypeptidase A inhibitor-like domain-containing protein n=1 Tax=Nicotiana attenuata TaxID=49451 RepID=A0A1J6HZH4_NICAT|nr:hypothetical protein A4A49_26805 [Nicotiana attenuata]
MAMLKLGLVLTILLVATTFNMVWFSNTHVDAARNADMDISGLERRLLPQLNSWVTCNNKCIVNSDCHGCWFCCTCTTWKLCGYIA